MKRFVKIAGWTVVAVVALLLGATALLGGFSPSGPATPLPADITRGWRPDSLGAGFEQRTVVQPDDYSGAVVSTIVRRLLPDSAEVRRGVLYVHGFNDYYFNAEMAEEFNRHGYDFYAVDLRKYGRSILPGQRPFQARSISEYFPDIDSALVVMEARGLREIVMMGHSTGGLITACYMSEKHPADVDALVLNSPFLDWNLGWEEKIVPLISAWGALFPNMEIEQGKSHAYAESLLASEHGRWNYNVDWKMTQSPAVTAGWIRAITRAQNSLRDGRADIRVPVLLMYSAESVRGSEWTPEHNRADGVLDVADIRRYGNELIGAGAPKDARVTDLVVPGGLHDLLLSAPEVTAPLYDSIFVWLDRTL